MKKKHHNRNTWHYGHQQVPTVQYAVKNAQKPMRESDDMKRLTFPINTIRERCNQGLKEFEHLGKTVWTQNGLRYIYIDNGADVLAVCHLDFVSGSRHFYSQYAHNEPYIFSSRLDDRLGLFVILDILPKLGLKYDVLLTDGEESARSTGEYFEPTKHYNWAFSFDRNGTDVVLYQFDYHNKLVTALEEIGCNIGWGSWSDIAGMNQLGCAAMNFGVGYRQEHSTLCHAPLYDMAYMITKFVRFYKTHKNTHFEWTEEDARLADHMAWGRYDYTSDYNSKVETDWECAACERDWNVCFHDPCTARLEYRNRADQITDKTVIGTGSVACVKKPDKVITYLPKPRMNKALSPEWEDDCPYCAQPISECDAHPCDTKYLMLRTEHEGWHDVNDPDVYDNTAGPMPWENDPKTAQEDWYPCAWCDGWIEFDSDTYYIVENSMNDVVCAMCADDVREEGFELYEVKNA